MSDDKDRSLLQLSRHYRASIISQLVDIGRECKSMLSFAPSSAASSVSSPKARSYAVVRSTPSASGVRNCVLDRILRYRRHTDIRFLWIDAHSIRQDTCGVDDCDRYPRCVEKRDAIQAMDLVYQLSKHPVALLGRPLQRGSELHLLTQILSGDLVDGDREFRFSPRTNVKVARKALLLAFHTRTREFRFRPATCL
ncbi:uncharacterized protein B0I36DRAFT_366635 [Microdochium trichocladiopsis]|uniref:Heterokaryon incompatibility domain-containing protein n=1 Tax=Microdochium trichocladiopsis TaxID=1682393 RepID=A0A9P8Y0Q0_9PEZI|nr:uncharacterized protein B0I36DRAFT_366635 [Microdochium trichocladiopsis]KAH7024711.1 hypothetical protein B0I36DRAFT_366635 [Microdochium trichocladiopsis]